MKTQGRYSIWNRLQRRGADERGVVAALVAIMATFALIPMMALAVDLGSYDQAQRQVQAAADAGALAASQDLPTTGTATTDGISYATKNFPGATATVTVNAAATQATVVVAATTPSIFGKFLGLKVENVSATAVAARTAPSTTCSTPGTGCDAIFAMDTTCSANNGIFFNGGGYNILGGVHTNGSFTSTGGGSAFGPTTYGTGTGCLNSSASNTFTAGPTAEAAVTTWPIPYATDFPACGGTGIACNATGTPSYCSASGTSFTFTGSSPPTTGYIYCAYGTGTKSTPTTWNGTITFSGGAIGTSSSPVVASYIAGNVITGSGGEFLATCGYTTTSLVYTASACKGASGQTMPAPATANYPLIYATDTLSPNNVPSGDTYAVNLGGGGNNWLGDIYAPTGQVVVAAGSQTTGFIEAWDVGFISGGITGDGPSDSGTTSTPGSESLVQ